MSDSDLEIKSAIPKKKATKRPKSPAPVTLENQETKKLNTKEMINIALTDLKSRKGTSLYAIKKYLHEKFLLDVEKKNYIIKKTLKDSVESGVIVQTKGVGASGSFKLAKKEKENTVRKTEKTVKKKEPGNEKKNKDKPKQKFAKETKVVTIEMVKSKSLDKKKTSNVAGEKIKLMKPVNGKGTQTPSKKKSNMVKRKSIGSIIKKPKMKPASKA